MFTLKNLCLLIVGYTVNYYVSRGSAIFDKVDHNLINKFVNRSIDLRSQLVKIKTNITLSNEGSKSVGYFLFLIPFDSRPNHKLAHFEAWQAVSGEGVILNVTNSNAKNNKNSKIYKIILHTNITPNGVTNIEVDTIYRKELIPKRLAIKQYEIQLGLVVYKGMSNFYTPYMTERQVTTILLSSTNVKNYTIHKPISISKERNLITYGPYLSLPPMKRANVEIHYENNSPFLSVRNLVRTIEISHWGNIAIKETITLVHDGTKLKGELNRLDRPIGLNEQKGNAPKSISNIGLESFTTFLPASAKNIIYCDNLGLITTYCSELLNDSLKLTLQPRFRLFRGSKINYEILYDLPIYNYLYKQDDNYLLKMPILERVFENMSIDDLSLKIILPEGSTDILLSTPYTVDELPRAKYYTYFNTDGHILVSFSKKNVVENHIRDFTLQYICSSKVSLLRKPLLFALVIFTALLVYILCFRLEFSTEQTPEEVT